MGQIDPAIKCYKGALQIEPKLSGAHYGLAFLLLKRGDVSDAAYHLEAFLMEPPKSQEAERWVRHARATLDALRTEPGQDDPAAEEPIAADDSVYDSSPGAE
jgi:thioredoxin-like negative regulator of GroEL